MWYFNGFRKLSFQEQAVRACLAVAYLFWKTIWPTQLHAYVQMPPDLDTSLFLQVVLSAAAVMLGSAVGFLNCRVGDRSIWSACSAVLCCWVIALFPALGWGGHGYGLTSDRYSYLPSLFLVPATAATICSAFKPSERAGHKNWQLSSSLQKLPQFSKTAVSFAVTSMIGVAVVQTGLQLTSFQSFSSLWLRCTEIDVSNPLANTQLGIHHREAGNLQLALTHFATVLQQHPTHPLARFELANTLTLQNEPDLAISHFRILAEQVPWHPEVFNNIGVIQQNRGESIEARLSFEQAVALSQGQWEESLKHLAFNCVLSEDFVTAFEVLSKLVELRGAQLVLPETTEQHTDSALLQYQTLLKQAQMKMASS